MTGDRDDTADDQLLTCLAELKTRDVSPRRSRQLRQKCLALLQAEPAAAGGPWMRNQAWRRLIVPALGGAWCVAYLVEVIRFAVANYEYLGVL